MSGRMGYAAGAMVLPGHRPTSGAATVLRPISSQVIDCWGQCLARSISAGAKSGQVNRCWVRVWPGGGLSGLVNMCGGQDMSASGCAGAGMWPGQIVSTPELGRNPPD